jgi:antibiotic biosynthesis monooxygenase (ABM) superfamily enzyme
MAIVLYQTRTTIDAARDEAFNKWYNERHCPDLLSFRGCVSARRYRAILGEDEFRYLAVYEFQDEPTFEAWMKSEHRQRMFEEHNTLFGPVEAERSAHVQIWPA